MSSFGRALFSGSPRLFWTLAPFLVAGALAITVPPRFESGLHFATVLACDLVLAFCALSLWPYKRLGWAQRGLTGTVAVMYTAYLVDACFPGLLPGGDARPWLAVAGFLVIGYPCWRHALTGSFPGPPEPIVIPDDEPLLLEAYAAARAALPELVAAFSRGRARGAFVRFAFESDEDVVEHLWAEVLAIDARGARVAVLTQPVSHSGALGELSIDASEVEDFEFEDEAGRFVGGFTTRAMVRFADREGLEVPPSVRRGLERYASAA